MINLCVAINRGSTKQCVEPESTSALKIKAEIKTVVTERNKVSGLKGVEVLRQPPLHGQDQCSPWSVWSPKGC